MTITALTFIPDSSPPPTPTLQTLLDRLTKLYNPTPLPRWTLDYRVMRETAAAAAAATDESSSSNKPESSSSSRPHLQILTLSHHHPGKSFVCVSCPHQQQQGQQRHEDKNSNNNNNNNNNNNAEQQPPPPLIIAVPHPSHSEELSLLLRTRLGPLWAARYTWAVVGGQAFELEDFRVWMGDLRTVAVSGRQSTTTAAQASRGVLVEIEWLGARDEGEVVLRAFWEALELGTLGALVRGDGLEIARLYCEVLGSGGAS